jgi:hypothetical protein
MLDTADDTNRMPSLPTKDPKQEMQVPFNHSDATRPATIDGNRATGRTGKIGEARAGQWCVLPTQAALTQGDTLSLLVVLRSIAPQ